MSKRIITINNLSKKYIIGENIHGRGARTFRDIFDHKLRSLFSRNSNKKHQDTILWALKDVSLEVNEGEAVGIIGRNGAGKTTLLKVLSRITEPTKGTVTLRGRVASLLEVGTGFSGELTGRENIYLNGSILGMRKAEIKKKFDEIVAFAEIEKFIDTPIKRYSSGMYVRLAFAVAAHLEPEILLVDEVLAVGDAAFQKKCLGKMGDVAKGGRTVLFVSHNLSAINQLCPRTILLDNGRVVRDGATGETLQCYAAMMTSADDPKGNLSSPRLRLSESNPHSRFKWAYIYILNSQGKFTKEIRFGEPFEIVFGGCASGKCEMVLIGLGLISKLAGVIFTTHQTYNGLPDTLPGGSSEFRVKIDPNMLAPGMYEIEIAAAGPNVSDRIPVATELHILSIPITPDRSWYTPHKAGVVDYPCRWSVVIPSKNPFG